jgi:hypothetical protein
VSAGLLFAVVVLGAAFLVLAYVVVRGAGNLVQLGSFVLLLGVVAALGYIFVVHILKYNPNPGRVAIANWLTKNKQIDLIKVVPGVYDLDYIYRIDTDGDPDEAVKEEWLTFYQYDVHVNPQAKQVQTKYTGPFGAAIYDLDECRPPAILSFELVPVGYDYLGENGTNIAVENIIPYNDPLSSNLDRPEVIIAGLTRGAVTDLNVFRKTGVAQSCFDRQQWLKAHPGETFPNPFRYDNVGSFRANYLIRRDGNTVSTFDRAPFERSQITIRRDYRPASGSYFQADGQTLLSPVEVSLAFGGARPDDVPLVYYPEKAILAFYLNLTKNEDQLKAANGYLSPDAQDIFNIKTDQFGIAMARDKLARVLVWEIRYEPDSDAERLHQDRSVTVTVVGVDGEGNIDYAHPCQVTWTIVGVEDPTARPYGCEWRLETYWSPCAIGK